MSDFAFYYIIITCVLAYSILIVIGWKVHKFAWTNSAKNLNQQWRVVELYKQITRTLIIQVIKLNVINN